MPMGHSKTSGLCPSHRFDQHPCHQNSLFTILTCHPSSEFYSFDTVDHCKMIEQRTTPERLSNHVGKCCVDVVSVDGALGLTGVRPAHRASIKSASGPTWCRISGRVGLVPPSLRDLTPGGSPAESYSLSSLIHPQRHG